MKLYNTIGCCGIDCGLCPRLYINGPSACPGCCGKDFLLKHPSCSFVTCCAIRMGLESCAYCAEFPCNRFENEKSGYDSFVTHQKVFPNLNFMQEKGMDLFLDLQKIRIDILKYFVRYFDDGRSKSYYCLSCTLLPTEKLQELQSFAYSIDNQYNIKDKCKILRMNIQKIAIKSNIDIRLRKK